MSVTYVRAVTDYVCIGIRTYSVLVTMTNAHFQNGSSLLHHGQGGAF